MTHSTKLEQILELLINEDQEKATELLHQIVIEKARSIYGELVQESDECDLTDSFSNAKDQIDNEETMEAVGGEGDVKADFIDDVETDTESQEGDEDENGEESEENEGTVEDRVEDLESELENLRAEFDRLMADEAGEEEHSDLGDDFGGEVSAEDEFNPEAMESLEEATKLSDEVSISLDQEGKLVGTGKNSKAPSVNKVSPISRPAHNMAGKPTAFSKAAGEGSHGNTSATKAAPGVANTNVKATNTSVKLDKEGKTVGDGSSVSVNKASPILKR